MRKIQKIFAGMATGCAMALAMPAFASASCFVNEGNVAGRPESAGASRMLYVEFHPSTMKNQESMVSRYKVGLAELPFARTKGRGMEGLEPYAAPLAVAGNPLLERVFVFRESAPILTFPQREGTARSRSIKDTTVERRTFPLPE